MLLLSRPSSTAVSVRIGGMYLHALLNPITRCHPFELDFSPKELMLGMVVNTSVNTRREGITCDSLATFRLKWLTLCSTIWMDTPQQSPITHAVHRKTAFDRGVRARGPGEVVFRPGQLVQLYRSDLDSSSFISPDSSVTSS